MSKVETILSTSTQTHKHMPSDRISRSACKTSATNKALNYDHFQVFVSVNFQDLGFIMAYCHGHVGRMFTHFY